MSENIRLDLAALRARVRGVEIRGNIFFVLINDLTDFPGEWHKSEKEEQESPSSGLRREKSFIRRFSLSNPDPFHIVIVSH